MKPRSLTLVGLTLIALIQSASAEIKFGDDLAAAQETARKEKKLVLVCLAAKDSDDRKKMDADFDSSSKLAELLDRKFKPVKLMADVAANKAVFKRFDADKLPTFVVLDSDGRILDRIVGYREQAHFAKWIDGMIELKTGLAMLEKADKTKPISMVAAIRKIGSVVSDRSYSVLVEFADDDDMPESVRKVAIEGLGKQKFGPEKLLPYLTHRNPTLKSAATSSIKQQGQAAAGAIVEGLASDNSELRVVCWSLLTAVNRDPKQVRSADFWRNGKPEERERTVGLLRDWQRDLRK